MSTEEWRPVVGYEGRYEVSDLGRVRSLTRRNEFRPGQFGLLRGRMLALHVNFKGYHTAALSRDGIRRHWFVHRLVAEAFLGPRPEGMEVRHLDGDPANNRPDNLAYGTRSENVLDSVRHGTHPEARKTHCKWGHPFSPENTHIDRKGKRDCRECRARRNRRITANRRAARLATQGVAA